MSNKYELYFNIHQSVRLIKNFNETMLIGKLFTRQPSTFLHEFALIFNIFTLILLIFEMFQLTFREIFHDHSVP